MNRTFLSLCLSLIAAPSFAADDDANATRIAFFVCGDPQYLAEHSANPSKLDPLSEQANSRFVELVNTLPSSELPDSMGGGHVASDLRGMIVVGDLIDSLDKNGGHYPAMQQFEWQRYLADYGLNGKDGRIQLPTYEFHGNHDGPQGDSFVIDAIIERNKTRVSVVNTSPNGLHYSWDWGPIHFINLGMFVGAGERRREDHHYAPRASLEFLKADLAAQVGESGRPVIISHHLHLDAPQYDWPAEDLAAYYTVIRDYNVIAIFNGHTHGSPPRHRRWNGLEIGPKMEGFDNYDPDDAGASKLHEGKPVGLAHGILYVEIMDHPGVDHDEMQVRSYATKDNWATARWDQNWRKPIQSPDLPRSPGRGRRAVPLKTVGEEQRQGAQQ